MAFGSWWLFWMACMVLFLCIPLGYGWGYRRWGLPYPSYIQRRRHARAIAAGGTSAFNHLSWGRTGDLVWLVLIIGMLWVSAAAWLGFK